MKTQPILISGALLMAAMSSGAWPVQTGEPVYPPAFSEVDKDKDGYISATEAKEGG